MRCMFANATFTGERATARSLENRSRGAVLSCRVRWHMRGGMRVPYHARAPQQREQRSRFGHCAKRGSDTQAAAPNRPTTSARTTADSPTPAPLAAAPARQKRRHSGATSQGQSNGSTASQPKRRRTPVAPATQNTERFLTPRATTAAPPNPPQDHPAPLPPPEPPPNPPQKPHGS